LWHVLLRVSSLPLVNPFTASRRATRSSPARRRSSARRAPRRPRP
jgi:hypothetical protein